MRSALASSGLDQMHPLNIGNALEIFDNLDRARVGKGDDQTVMKL